MSTSFLSVATEEGVALITISRPPVNAINRELLSQLSATMDLYASDSSVRAIVIASGLPAIYSAGADIRELDTLDEAEGQAFVLRGQQLMNQLEALPKPIITAIRGACVGGGCELAMACDLRVAGQSSRFGQPEVNLGILPGWGGSQRLPRLIGKTMAMELLMTGEPITAEKALAIGLVNYVVPDEAALTMAMAMATKLASKSPIALAGIKRAVMDGLYSTLAHGLEVEAQQFQETHGTADAREGIRAFLEKRPPRSTGP